MRVASYDSGIRVINHRHHTTGGHHMNITLVLRNGTRNTYEGKDATDIETARYMMQCDANYEARTGQRDPLHIIEVLTDA